MTEFNSLFSCKLELLSDFTTGLSGPSTKNVPRHYNFHLELAKKGTLTINETAQISNETLETRHISLITKVNNAKII